MKSIFPFLAFILIFLGCSGGPTVDEKEQTQLSVKKNSSTATLERPKILFPNLPKTYLVKSKFVDLPNWEEENYISALDAFIESCQSLQTQKLYKNLCGKAMKTTNPKEFLQKEFKPYQITQKDGEREGLLTGYYEPHINGSLTKNEKYKYPIYGTPNDLITVDLSSIYPNLKNYRLRGRIEGKKLVPYYTRKETKSKHLNADVICYCDSKIDRFFLEIQGSGKVHLDNNETMYIGFDNQNGHSYRAIGRYLVKIKELKAEEVSLQSIKKWLENHPERVDEVLNYNKSVVYFREKEDSASGALGLTLTPKRSIAVDKRYIPLGSMLYLSAEHEDKKLNKVVMAQDTGGAIKGAVRADIFLGDTKEAEALAGELKAPLKLWILLPKNVEVSSL